MSMFEDDFNDPALPGWMQINPTWSVANGVLTGDDPTHQEGDQLGPIIVAGDSSWTDYEVTVSTRILSSYASTRPIGETAVILRYVDSNNYYWVGLGCYNRKVSLGIRINNVPTELAFAGVQSDLEQGRTYVLKAAIRGQEITLYLDGVEVLRKDVAGPLVGGLAGLRPYASKAEYDYFNVAVPAPEPTLLYILILGAAAVALAASANILGVFGVRKKR